ncbi:hypothetical protein SeMB42_g06924 [Synchytrium endobioticum]|uniref:Uncharacterized protein n=1 Tax=Synchytrium endobioticum TaxID=286115 RepID=A0A507CCK7_9FUNG|nr:hypothetical protein SeMB42_g06924 [Synchytrium endobioticum]
MARIHRLWSVIVIGLLATTFINIQPSAAVDCDDEPHLQLKSVIRRSGHRPVKILSEDDYSMLNGPDDAPLAVQQEQTHSCTVYSFYWLCVLAVLLMPALEHVAAIAGVLAILFIASLYRFAIKSVHVVHMRYSHSMARMLLVPLAVRREYRMLQAQQQRLSDGRASTPEGTPLVCDQMWLSVSHKGHLEAPVETYAAAGEETDAGHGVGDSDILFPFQDMCFIRGFPLRSIAAIRRYLQFRTQIAFERRICTVRRAIEAATSRDIAGDHDAGRDREARPWMHGRFSVAATIMNTLGLLLVLSLPMGVLYQAGVVEDWKVMGVCGVALLLAMAVVRVWFGAYRSALDDTLFCKFSGMPRRTITHASALKVSAAIYGPRCPNADEHQGPGLAPNGATSVAQSSARNAVIRGDDNDHMSRSHALHLQSHTRDVHDRWRGLGSKSGSSSRRFFIHFHPDTPCIPLLAQLVSHVSS